jgi:ABC-type multidrug transport system fused ATPase/permease subunit
LANLDNHCESETAVLPDRLYRYIAATSWMHQVLLVILTVAVFLLEAVPLELQRRVINDIDKHRPFRAIVMLCVAYAAAILLQGGIKLGLNIYRSWVGERAKRDLRRRITAFSRAASSSLAEVQGTTVAIMVAEVEPVGGFVGSSVSEPLLQLGILATVIGYIFHLDPWMGAAAIALFVPQLVFVPLMQHAMNRRTGARVWLLRQIGSGLIAPGPHAAAGDPATTARIDRVLQLNMRIFELKFAMNFLMNVCSHLQVIVALLLGGWWVLHQEIEIGAVVAFISGVGRLNDPWGDVVNYFRDATMNGVKYRLIAGWMTPPGAAPANLLRGPAARSRVVGAGQASKVS